MKRAAIYARVSTSEQADNGTSLETQVEACVKYAQANDFRVMETVTEDRSGGTLERPGLDRIRELAREGEIDAVIFYALDRLSRDDTDTLILAREWRGRGMSLECATVRLEDTPQGQFLMTLLAAFGKLERAQILERTTRGKRAVAKAGKVMTGGLVPYGYDNVDGKLVVNPVEAEAVQAMFRWLGEEHIPLYQVAMRLTAGGYPTKRGGTWHKQTILNILTSETCIGRWYFNKYQPTKAKTRREDHPSTKEKSGQVLRPREEWIEIACPRLVSDELFQEVQRRLQQNKVDNPRNQKVKYLLKSLVKCRICGRRFQGHSRQGREPQYLCLAKNSAYRGAGHKPCPNPPVMGSQLEDKVWAKVVHFLSNPSIVVDWASADSAEWQAEQAGDQAELRTLDRQAKEAATQESALLDLHLTGRVRQELYDQKYAEIGQRQEFIEGERQRLQARIQQRQQASVNRASVVALTRRYRRWLEEFGRNPPFEMKRAMLEALKVEVIADPDPTKTEVKGVFSAGYFKLKPDGRVAGLPGISRKVIEIATKTGLPAMTGDAHVIYSQQYQGGIRAV